MFHLLSHDEGTGGLSIFVDGYAAAAYLRDNNPDIYLWLHRKKILFHACGNAEVGEIENIAFFSEGDAVLSGGKSIGLDHRLRGAIIDPKRVPTQIRWNNYDRDVQCWPNLKSMEQWYKAARKWNEILQMEKFEIKVQLKPGQPIIFDNWRYLHGRTGFSGKRRICGGYSKSYVFEYSTLSICLLSMLYCLYILLFVPAT